VTLAQARAKRDEAKKLLVQGIDPKAEQKEAQAENSGAYTFETIAREWHASNKRWSEDHRSRVLRYLELYIFPYIGSSDIRQLKTSHLLAPIKKVDASGKHDVAQRLQQRVRPLCVMPYRTITSTQIQPVIWPVRYRQPKRDITRLTLQPVP
jgi:integrase